MQVRRLAYIEENSLAFGLLGSGSLPPGLGERARLGCRRVRPAPDMEKFKRPLASFFQVAPRGGGGAPEGGRAPRDFSRATSLSPERFLRL